MPCMFPLYQETCQTCAVKPPSCVRYYAMQFSSVAKEMSIVCVYAAASLCEVLWHACLACIKRHAKRDMSSMGSYAASTCEVLPYVRYEGMHVSSVSRDMSNMCSYAASMCEVLWHALITPVMSRVAFGSGSLEQGIPCQLSYNRYTWCRVKLLQSLTGWRPCNLWEHGQ